MQLIAMDVWYQASLTSLVYGKMVLNHGRLVSVSKTTWLISFKKGISC